MTDDDKLLASLTGFTPGPWVWGEYNNGLDGNGDVVLTYYDYEGMSCGDDANAALIAAAPELHRIATERGAEKERLRDDIIEREAELIYLRKHGKDGALWSANHSKDVWRDMARAALEAKS